MEHLTLVEYRFLVEEAAVLKSGAPIYNGSPAHAQVVTETLFKHAEEAVCVLSGNLHQSVYGDSRTLSAAEDFVSRGGKIRVLHEREPDGGSENRFRLCFGERSESVKIVRIPEYLSKIFEFHMMAADGNNYRFEPDKHAPAAIVAFGDQSTAKHLTGLFDQLWTASQQDLVPA